MTPSVHQLYEVTEGTWPPAQVWDAGPWRLRDGAGGGKRVSAATANGAVTAADIQQACAQMEPPLFMVRAGEDDLDAALATAGLRVIDPVILYSLPIERLTDLPIPRVTAFEIWEPLAVMKEIWAAGGLGPARLDVMARAKVKTGILSRWNEKPAGAAFAAMHDDICMVHAVEVLPHQRRQGVAQWMMRKAAFWGQRQGARHISVLCVAENAAANAMYRGLGFEDVGRYHYRIGVKNKDE